MPLLIAFILIPAIEIAVLIQVGGAIGVGWTLLGILATAGIGLALIRRQGLATLARANAQMEAGRPPVAELLTAACLLVAGICLLTPGFVTDTFGFLLLVPPVRALLGLWLVRQLGPHSRFTMMHEAQVRRGETPDTEDADHGFTNQSLPPIIEGDYEEIPHNGKD